MPRSVNSVAKRARRKKVLKQAKGYFGRRKNVWTVAKNAVDKAMLYSYRDRRNKKRNTSIYIASRSCLLFLFLRSRTNIASLFQPHFLLLSKRFYDVQSNLLLVSEPFFFWLFLLLNLLILA